MVKYKRVSLSRGQLLAIYYHNLFDYPLTEYDLKKWSVGKKYKGSNTLKVTSDGKYYFIKGRSKIVKIRENREKYKYDKLRLVRKAANLLIHIPSILFIGVTGSLAMGNSDEKSDIDLMFITRKDCLWTSRVLVYFLLKIKGFELRKPGDRREKDKLCLNLWLDEKNLLWDKKNIFTAHEIAQIIPLENKFGTYEKFISCNNWIFNYWPNSLDIKSSRKHNGENYRNQQRLGLIIFLGKFVEPMVFYLQKLYMQSKITNEIVQKNRAVFHPVDLSGEIVRKFSKIDILK